VDPSFQPFIATPASEALFAKLPAGWEAAEKYRLVVASMAHGPLRREAGRRAVDAVLARARDLLRHAMSPVRERYGSWPEDGDLDLEGTLDCGFDPKSPVLAVKRREPRQAELVLIIDTSLSMTGERVALVAVAAAILKLKLQNVAVVAFDTTASVLVRCRNPVPAPELVRRILDVPAQGYTNIGDGLAKGLLELATSPRHERVAMLLTDGAGNVGWDPVAQASRFQRLHVVHVGRPVGRGPKVCAQLAAAGNGRLFKAASHTDLPGVIRQALRTVFRA
jgi:Mg-chelatase subunit ChlD